MHYTLSISLSLALPRSVSLSRSLSLSFHAQIFMHVYIRQPIVRPMTQMMGIFYVLYATKKKADFTIFNTEGGAFGFVKL